MKKNTAEKHGTDAPIKIDKEIVDISKDDWTDPRDKKERRQNKDSSKIPPSGCRRKDDRRVTRYIRDDQWWLYRSYNKGEK